MSIYVRDVENPQEARGPVLTHAFRPFKCCEFLCFNRPEMFIKNSRGLQVGHVRAPFTVCDARVDAGPPAADRVDQGDPDPDALKGDGWPYTITASCCQAGLYCKLPSGPCKRVLFDIKDRSDETVGELQHVVAGCCKLMVDVDNYAIRFPVGATVRSRNSRVFGNQVTVRG